MKRLKISKLNSNLLALLTSILGVSMLFVSLYVMQNLDKDNADQKKIKASKFEVKRQKKKKKQVAKRKTTPKKKRSRPKVTPPSLNNSLVGSSFGLDQFEFLAESGNGLLGKNKNVIMTEDTVDSVPRARYRPNIDYPSHARSRSIEGYVLLNMLISSNGEVENVKLISSEPKGVFDEVAINNAKEWQFDAATYEGQPVKVWVQQKVSFNLN